MTDHAGAGPAAGFRFWIAGLCAIAIAVFVGANAHLIYVSVSSQPECVPHLKAPGEGAAQYRAAMPSC